MEERVGLVYALEFGFIGSRNQSPYWLVVAACYTFMSHSSSVVPSIEGREGEELKRRECVEKIKSSLSADPALARMFARRNRLLRNGEIFKARFGDYKPCSCGINTSKAASFSLLEKIRKDLESSAPEVLDSHLIIEVTPLCEMAIKEASVERGTQFELRRIIEVRAMGCFIKTYYITFEAENPSKKNPVTFQAVGQAGEVRGGKEILDWKIEESGGTGCKEPSCAQPLDLGAELRTLRIEGCGEQIARKKMKQVKGKPRQMNRNVRASGLPVKRYEYCDVHSGEGFHSIHTIALARRVHSCSFGLCGRSEIVLFMRDRRTLHDTL